jgi:hypothetical protein
LRSCDALFLLYFVAIDDGATMPTDREATYARTAGCEVNHTPDGFVVYQAKEEKVHYLNPTAAMIYELCDARLNAPAIATYLQNAFSLPEPPMTEVTDCIDSLIAQGLIQLC